MRQELTVSSIFYFHCTRRTLITLRSLFSTFSLLALSAYGSSGTSSGSLGIGQSGFAAKGPLENFRVFVNENGDGNGKVSVDDFIVPVGGNRRDRVEILGSLVSTI